MVSKYIWGPIAIGALVAVIAFREQIADAMTKLGVGAATLGVGIQTGISAILSPRVVPTIGLKVEWPAGVKVEPIPCGLMDPGMRTAPCDVQTRGTTVVPGPTGETVQRRGVPGVTMPGIVGPAILRT